MPPPNHALYLQAAKDPSMTISEAPYPSCGPDELIIKTTAVAINPADVIVQKTGILITKYPAILGCDAAGIVVEIGSNLAPRFQIGEHVFGATGPLEDYKYAGFQEYVVLKSPSIAKVPENVKDSEDKGADADIGAAEDPVLAGGPGGAGPVDDTAKKNKKNKICSNCSLKGYRYL